MAQSTAVLADIRYVVHQDAIGTNRAAERWFTTEAAARQWQHRNQPLWHTTQVRIRSRRKAEVGY